MTPRPERKPSMVTDHMMLNNLSDHTATTCPAAEESTNYVSPYEAREFATGYNRKARRAAVAKARKKK